MTEDEKKNRNVDKTTPKSRTLFKKMVNERTDTKAVKNEWSIIQKIILGTAKGK